MDPFLKLLVGLGEAEARFVLIGVWAANYYAKAGSTLFGTLDRDLFLPLDPANLLSVWRTCQALGLRLWAADEPLGEPLDVDLARRVTRHRALTRAFDDEGLQVDLSLVMAGYQFQEVWDQRRIFRVQAVEVPVARLAHIVASKAKASRPKDRLFLETHAQALRELRDED